MNTLFLIVAHNSLAALVWAILVYLLTRFWRNAAAAHCLWLIVLLRLIAPPMVLVDWTIPKWISTTNGSQVAVTDAHEEIPSPATESLFDIRNPETSPTEAIGSDVISLSMNQSSVAAPLQMLGGVFAVAWRSIGDHAVSIVYWVWIGGAALCALLAMMRIRRFERLLRETLPAPGRIEQLTRDVAASIGLKQAPRICYVQSVDVPLVWHSIGRPVLVVPMHLFKKLDDRSAAMILAHELAHLKRRDHCVRALELLVSTIYWWNPLAFVIRRRIHDAEDLCCDAWVREMFPDDAPQYAEVMLQAAESLSGRGAFDLRLLASPLFHSQSLKGRIEMILNGRCASRMSNRSRWIAILMALLILPSFIRIAGNEVVATADEPSSTTTVEQSATSKLEFPYVVKFELGETKFLEGDGITILEVRGTSETMSPGEMYSIRGTYTLGTHDKARLDVGTTASDARNGLSSGLKLQTSVVSRGSGTFTLILPMLYKGWPHVSFYPMDGRSGFGGVYFGVGDSVLKPSSKKDEPLAQSRDEALRAQRQAQLLQAQLEVLITEQDANRVPQAQHEARLQSLKAQQEAQLRQAQLEVLLAQPEAHQVPHAHQEALLQSLKAYQASLAAQSIVPRNKLLPYTVKFEQGATKFLDGDKITIDEIRGSAETVTSGNFYWVKGTYTLASHDEAKLAASTTAAEASDGYGEWITFQTTTVKRGSGSFTLVLPMSCKGWPHISFYGGGESFGGIYFGTGDSVLKKWWGSNEDAVGDLGGAKDGMRLDNPRPAVGTGMRLSVPMMGPVPIAIDLGLPILTQSTDLQKIIEFYVGTNR